MQHVLQTRRGGGAAKLDSRDTILLAVVSGLHLHEPLNAVVRRWVPPPSNPPGAHRSIFQIESRGLC